MKHKIIIGCLLALLYSSGTSASNHPETPLGSIVGVQIFDNFLSDDSSHEEFKKRIYERMDSCKNSRIALMFLMLKNDSNGKKSISPDVLYLRPNLTVEGIKIIDVKDSIIENLVDATNHYYLLEDTIIPVIFESDIITVGTIFSKIQYED